eukprot:gene36158-47013_t
MRKSLLLKDFDSVVIKVLDGVQARPVLPSHIRLCPLEWRVVDAKGKATANTTATGLVQEDFSSDRKRQAVLRSICRYIRTEIELNGTVVLSHGSVVSLAVNNNMELSKRSSKDGYLDVTRSLDFALDLRDAGNSEPQKGKDVNQEMRTAPMFCLVNRIDENVLYRIASECIMGPSLQASITSELSVAIRDEEMFSGSSSVSAIGSESCIPSGMSEFMNEVLRDVFAAVLPLAVMDRIRIGLHPPSGVLIAGALGTGKTHVLHRIEMFLQRCPRTTLYTHMCDCAALKGLPMTHVRASLTAAFPPCKEHCPAVLLIGNVDLL